MIKKGFYAVDEKDNVATALWDMESGTGEVFGAVSMKITVKEPVRCGYKIALQDIEKDSIVYKYGVCIGKAESSISTGMLVHSHNLSSLCDSRSSGFDPRTAVPEDVEYSLRGIKGAGIWKKLIKSVDT